MPTRHIQEKWKLNNVQELPIELKGLNREGLYDLFAAFGYKRGAEVGVWEGSNATRMFERILDLELFLIDPYKDYSRGRKRRGNRQLRKVEKNAHRRVKDHNAKFLKMFSEDAIRKIEDGSLDFVYIDGNHTYDYTMLDIILWTRKVKPGGIISGHDYYHGERSRVECKLAVDDYTLRHKINPWYITDLEAERITKKRNARRSWFWVKE